MKFPKRYPTIWDESGKVIPNRFHFETKEIDAWREALRKRVLYQEKDAQLDSNEEMFCKELLEEWL
jgi:hypothetical protein